MAPHVTSKGITQKNWILSYLLEEILWFYFVVITITYDPSLWNVTTCIWNRVSVFSSAEYISAICIFHNFFIQVLLLFWGWKHFISIFSIRSSLSSSVSTEISWYVQNRIDLQTYQLFFLYQLQKSKPHILRTESLISSMWIWISSRLVMDKSINL